MQEAGGWGKQTLPTRFHGRCCTVGTFLFGSPNNNPLAAHRPSWPLRMTRLGLPCHICQENCSQRWAHGPGRSVIPEQQVCIGKKIAYSTVGSVSLLLLKTSAINHTRSSWQQRLAECFWMRSFKTCYSNFIVENISTIPTDSITWLLYDLP